MSLSEPSANVWQLIFTLLNCVCYVHIMLCVTLYVYCPAWQMLDLLSDCPLQRAVCNCNKDIIIIIILDPSTQFPWWIKKIKYTKNKTGMVPNPAGSQQKKMSCSKTELKHCTTTETCWKRKFPSQSSPEDAEIRQPRSHSNCCASSFSGPRVSTAIGKK